MDAKELMTDAQIYVPLLLGCTKVVALSKGTHLHDQIVAKNVNVDTPLANALINMYGKCGMMAKAFEVFSEMDIKGIKRDIFTWSTAIQICGIHKQGRMAIELFERMVAETSPNKYIAALPLYPILSCVVLFGIYENHQNRPRALYWIYSVFLVLDFVANFARYTLRNERLNLQESQNLKIDKNFNFFC